MQNKDEIVKALLDEDFQFSASLVEDAFAGAATAALGQYTPGRPVGEYTELAVRWSLNEMVSGVRDDAPGSHTSPRIREYLKPCYRRVPGAFGGPAETPLDLTAGNWCAASACHAIYAQGCAAHPYRASGIEMEEDAKSGKYDVEWSHVPGMSPLVPLACRIPLGSLAIFQRGNPMDPSSKWMRHVARLLTSPNERGVFFTIGGNEGGEWHVKRIAIGADRSLRGFIVYSDRVRHLALANEETHQ